MVDSGRHSFRFVSPVLILFTNNVKYLVSVNHGEQRFISIMEFKGTITNATQKSGQTRQPHQPIRIIYTHDALI